MFKKSLSRKHSMVGHHSEWKGAMHVVSSQKHLHQILLNMFLVVARLTKLIFRCEYIPLILVNVRQTTHRLLFSLEPNVVGWNCSLTLSNFGLLKHRRPFGGMYLYTRNQLAKVESIMPSTYTTKNRLQLGLAANSLHKVYVRWVHLLS